MSYQDQTKTELADELRDRDLPVGGSKRELVDRLTAADREGPNDAGIDASGGSRASTAGGGRKATKPLQLARLAARQLEQASGRKVDGVSGLQRAEEGWALDLDPGESARTRPATDVIGSYEVVVDEDGDLVRYERIRRYIRGQAGEDQG